MKFYLTVNPHGGTKSGPEILKKIKPLFDNSNIELNIIETMFKGHAKELAEQLDFSDYDGLISIGGDGTLHEVVNGFMVRKDQNNFPIGIIPGGSGNSFMRDLELTDPIKAANFIKKIESSVDKWWYDKDLQKIRTNFCNNFAKHSKHPIKDLKNILL